MRYLKARHLVGLAVDGYSSTTPKRLSRTMNLFTVGRGGTPTGNGTKGNNEFYPSLRFHNINLTDTIGDLSEERRIHHPQGLNRKRVRLQGTEPDTIGGGYRTIVEKRSPNGT